MMKYPSCQIVEIEGKDETPVHLPGLPATGPIGKKSEETQTWLPAPFNRNKLDGQI